MIVCCKKHCGTAQVWVSCRADDEFGFARARVAARIEQGAQRRKLEPRLVERATGKDDDLRLNERCRIGEHDGEVFHGLARCTTTGPGLTARHKAEAPAATASSTAMHPA